MRNLKVIFLILTLNFIVLGHAQNKIALVVGIGRYPQESGWSTIHGDHDILMVEEMLRKNGFENDNIVALKNEGATRTAIIQALEQIYHKIKKGDVVYIHFSGHGQPFEDDEPYDESDGWDESIIPYDAKQNYCIGEYEGTNHIIDDELYGYLQTYRSALGPKGFIMVVIDACHAGGSSRSEIDDDYGLYCRGSSVGFSSNGKEYHPRINAEGNFSIDIDDNLSHIIVLEACRSYQSNYEIQQNGLYYGPLSFYVCQYYQSHSIEPKFQSILDIKAMMDSDARLYRQNMVYETSIQ